MEVEVDHSGYIGHTQVPSVLAFANGAHYAILIPATVKQAVVHELRRRGLSETRLYLQLFAVGLYLLLKERIQRLTLVTIDDEFTDHSPEIKEHLLNLLRRAGIRVPSGIIQFDHIGKGAPADALARAVYQKRQKPNRVIGLDEILAEFK